MLQVYFDESGTHSESPIICMAGYISTVEQWTHFSRNWQERIDKEGIDCFHMTDFENRRGPFKGMSKAKGNLLIESLIKIINVRVRYLFALAFAKADFDDVVGDKYIRTVGTEWTFCAMACMAFIRQWADQRAEKDPINFFFEQGARHSKALLAAHTKASKNKEFVSSMNLGTFTLGNRRNLPPLQAADILAYEAYKYRFNQLKRPELPMRKSLEALLDVPHTDYFARKDTLEFLVSFITKDDDLP